MRISIDNGASFTTAAVAAAVMPWAVIVSYMDEELLEKIAEEYAPCSEVEFLEHYLAAAETDLIIG